ncbi:MAG: CdaR family protein [Desulfobacterales bacterium]|nr:CdaR family protein [Desulfobacterales bacterium]
MTIGTLVTLLWLRPDAREMDIFIPIRFENIPPNLTYSNTGASGLDLLVRGNQAGIDRLINTPPSYVVDLSGTTAGVTQIPIRMETLPMPKGVSAVRINPESITLKIWKKITKKLPVALSFDGNVPTGYQANIIADPEQITVSGPETLLEPITAVPTKAFSIANATESFKKEISLDLPEGITILDNIQVIVAHITIEEKIIVRTFKDIKVKWRHSNHMVSISPPVITLEVKGAENTLSRLKAENAIEVFLDLSDVPPGKYVRRAAIDLPVGTTLSGVTPELFTVAITSK